MEEESERSHLSADGPAILLILDEVDDGDYLKEVLRLAEGQTEDLLDSALENEASALGVPVALHNMSRGWDSSLCEAIIASASKNARYGSNGSQSSISSHPTSPRSSNEKTLNSSIDQASVKRNSVSFSDYEKFLSKSNISATTTPLSRNSSTVNFPRLSSEGPSTSSLPPRKSASSFRHGLRNLSVRMAKTKKLKDNACIRCQKDLKHTHTLRSLPCSHIYCHECLHDLVQQAILAESRMPPKCCGIALPAHLLKSILNHHEQVSFMKSFQQYSTPWEDSIFCPSTACGEFVPKPSKVDPRHPFQLQCVECGTKVCSLCKQVAHGTAVQCPLDYELETIRSGDGNEWRRCFNCQSLVKAKQGCTSYITCRCMSRFCYSCGGVWDMVEGCPNNCYEDKHKSASQLDDEESNRHTEQSVEAQQFRGRQREELGRFCLYQDDMKKRMWSRHVQMKVNLLDRYAEFEAAMELRHKAETSKQETRHLMKEAELIEDQAKYRRMVYATIRHMETYCERHSLASGSESDISSQSSLASDGRSVVTEKERIELQRQLHIRADIPRRQESEINVLRGKQEKQVEELEAKHEAELAKFAGDSQKELERLKDTSLQEEGRFNALFGQRKERLENRWHLEAEVMRKKLETSTGLLYAPVPEIDWPEPAKRPEALSLER